MSNFSPIKKLASETAIYGLSTILARMINFFFVPIYTRVLTRENYGSYTEIMSYIAVLQVVLILGLETGCFKFANSIKNSTHEYEGMTPKDPFATSFITILGTSALFWLSLVLFAEPLAGMIGYAGYRQMIIYTGGILALDSVTAIMFAQLRYKEKALKFAVFKTIKIVSELGFNLLLFFVVPKYLVQHPQSLLTAFIPAQPDFSYIVFAVFLSCIVCTLLFVPDILHLKLRFNGKLLKKLLVYSLPLMIAGLPGIVNESLDRILFRYFAPEGAIWRAELGIYGAALKLAVIMNLFIQMFRYAAEPFFFARGKNRELLAQVMEYFVAFCMIIFLGIMFYMDVIKLILGKDFRGAVGTVPVMLLSYMGLGMLFNVSMWYKLSGQTKYAVTITLAGLAVTFVINVVFMPYFSYWASVFAHLLSVTCMLVYSVKLGNRYYPIPYRWGIICKYIGVGLVLYGVSCLMSTFVWSSISASHAAVELIKIIFNTILLIVFLLYCLRETGLYSVIKARLGR